MTDLSTAWEEGRNHGAQFPYGKRGLAADDNPYKEASAAVDALESAAADIEENPYEDLDPFYADWLRDRARRIREGENI